MTPQEAAIAQREKEWPTLEMTLYKFFDCVGNLLYVGATCDWVRRFRWHRSQSKWFKSIDYIELILFPSPCIVYDAEAWAIQNELPIYNIDDGWGIAEDANFGLAEVFIRMPMSSMLSQASRKS